MMDLREKLNQFHKRAVPEQRSDTRQRLNSLFRPRKVFLKQDPVDIESTLNSQIVTSAHEGVLISEYESNISYTEHDNMSTRAFQKLFNQSSDSYSLKDTLFLDTETTGLTRGTGTYAFVIGAGFFQNNRFVVRQYFLKKYDAESAMLESFEELLNSHRHIISFNGKCYDMPLLVSRFIICQKQTCLPELPHTDLLYAARGLWKKQLNSVTFSCLEKEILKKKRCDDIPGWMIPSVYFNYQRQGETDKLKHIFNHNLDDIVGLMLLYRELSQRFMFPDQYKSTRFHAARYLFEKAPEKSLALLELTVRDPYRSEDTYQAMKLLGQYYKKQGNYEQALCYWERMIHVNPQIELTPFIELAKYYEHMAKDFIKARDIINHALSFNFPLDKDLWHRQKRIERKLSQSMST